LTGAFREEFFIHHIANIDVSVNYLKSARGEKLPDYIIFRKNKKTAERNFRGGQADSFPTGKFG